MCVCSSIWSTVHITFQDSTALILLILFYFYMAWKGTILVYASTQLKDFICLMHFKVRVHARLSSVAFACFSSAEREGIVETQYCSVSTKLLNPSLPHPLNLLNVHHSSNELQNIA